MSKNIVKPKSVSFEDALRNLASRLTGQPANLLPRTQEGVVQFMAENVPVPAVDGIDTNQLAEAITQEVLARLDVNQLAEAVTKEALARLIVAVPGEGEVPGTAPGEQKDPDTAQQEVHNGLDALGGTPTPGEGETPNVEAPVADSKPKRGSKAKAAK